MGADRAREREGVTGGPPDVADEREAVTKVVRELVEVSALPRSRFNDVRAAPLWWRGFGCGRPHVDKLHLEQSGRRGDGWDDALTLGEADLDRDAKTVRLLRRVEVGRDPLSVAEPQDRLANLCAVSR